MNIKIKNISKKYGVTEVLKNIDLQFKSNEITTLLGSSGSGKTTLLRIIAGLEDANDGEIYFGDDLVYSVSKNMNIETSKRNLGFVFQDFALWPHMTVFENVVYGLKVKKDKNYKEKGLDVIKKVKISGLENRYPHELSGGQQQRVSLARALCVKPVAILLDEPFSALDQGLRIKMREEVKELISQNNITAIFVTHDQEEALQISNNIVLLNNGCIEQYGTPRELYENPKTKMAFDFIGKGNFIDDNHGIRPQYVSLENSNEVDKVVKSKVISSLYTGDKFENNVLVMDKVWKVYSEKELEIGSTVYLKLEENRIVKF